MDTLAELIAELNKKLAELGPDVPVRTYDARDDTYERPFNDPEHWKFKELREYIGPPFKHPRDGSWSAAVKAHWAEANKHPEYWKTHKALVIN